MIANGHCLLVSRGSKTSSNSRALRRCQPRSVCCSLCFRPFYSTHNPQPRVFKANQNPRLPGRPLTPSRCQVTFPVLSPCAPGGRSLSLKMIVYKVLLVCKVILLAVQKFAESPATSLCFLVFKGLICRVSGLI